MTGSPAADSAAASRRLIAYNVVAQGAGRLATVVLSIVTLRVLTSYLGPESFGQLTTALAFVALFIVVADGGLGTIVSRDMAKDAEGAELLMGTTLVLRSLASIGLVPICVGAGWLVFRGDHQVSSSVAVLSCLVVLTTVESALAVVFAARVRNDLTAAIDVVVKAVTLAGISWVAISHGGYRAVLAVYAASGLVGAALAWVGARRLTRVRPSIDVARWRPLVWIALPLGLVQLLNAVYYRVDTVLLSVLRPLSDVGLYGVAYRVIDLVISVPSIVMVALMPSLATADSVRLHALSQKALDVMIAMAIPVLVGGVLLRRQIVVGVSSGGFRHAATPFVILMIGATASFANAVYGNVLIAANRQSVLVRLTVLVLSVNVVLNLVLVPGLGAAGAAAATSACELISMAYVIRIHRREIGTNLHYRQAAKSSLAAAAMLAVYFGLRSAYPLSAHDVAATALAVALLGAVYAIVLALARGVPAFDVGPTAWRRA